VGIIGSIIFLGKKQDYWIFSLAKTNYHGYFSFKKVMPGDNHRIFKKII